MGNLFTAQTADTSGAQNTVELKNLGSQQYVVVWAEGTFDSASVGLEIRPYGTTAWITEADMTFTAEGAKALLVPHKMDVRGTVSSAGASTSINMGVS